MLPYTQKIDFPKCSPSQHHGAVDDFAVAEDKIFQVGASDLWERKKHACALTLTYEY